MVKITLEIEGMSCGMCETHVNDTIRRQFDIRKVSSSHSKGKTEILAENLLDEDALRKAIGEMGYTVLSVETESYVKRGEKNKNMTKNIQTKREREKALVSQMIHLYCRKKHHTRKELCAECAELKTYSVERSDKCPFMETKTFCSNCKVHCYKPEMREKIREFMRFSGPRMIFYHPMIAVRHVVETKKEKKRLEEDG